MIIFCRLLKREKLKTLLFIKTNLNNSIFIIDKFVFYKLIIQSKVNSIVGLLLNSLLRIKILYI